MRQAIRAGGAALVAALLLTGCATDVQGELRREVANVTDDANAGDYEAVQDSAESLIARAEEAVRSNDISPEEGARIIELATLLRDRAAALEPVEPSPTPEPVETVTEVETEPETETEETETETEPPATTRPPAPRPTQAPASPAPEPSPAPQETLLPEVPEG